MESLLKPFFPKVLVLPLIPLLFLILLPGLAFGNLTEDSNALNDKAKIQQNILAASEIITDVLTESHDNIVKKVNKEASLVPEGDKVSITDPYAYHVSFNTNLIIGQFCASKNSYQDINLKELKYVLQKNCNEIFTYKTSTQKLTVNVPQGNGEHDAASTITLYTFEICFAGDTYFADQVFHLTDSQKQLAKSYAENLTLLLGTSASGDIAYAKVSDDVLAYRTVVENIAAKYNMTEYIELILAVMMQESGGHGLDVMQSSEGAFNTKYARIPNGITDPQYSIECGIQELKYALSKAGCSGASDLDRIKLGLQGYNYGAGYIDWAMERDGGYTEENAADYSILMCSRPNWNYDHYGDKQYVQHVLRYYIITSTGGTYPATGMQIPHYLQTDYSDVPYGSGSIATSGCGPTSFAMVASYLTGTTITPVDAVSWCGNSYYKPGVGTYWSYFEAAAKHFNCGSVTETTSMKQVVKALKAGHPVICSQRAGLFTRKGHFIVLRGITSDGKILVNDPNDNTSKNYINRAFDMEKEIHATANAYWIFQKK